MLYLFTLIPLRLSTYISLSLHTLSLSHSLYILSIYLPLYTIYTFSLSISLHSLPPHQHTIIISSFLHSLYLSVPTLYLSTLSVYLYTSSTLFTHTLYLHTLLLYLSTSLHTLYTLSTLYLSISIYSLYLHSIYLPSSPTYIILILLLYDLYITLCVLRRYSLFCRELEGVMIIVDRLRNS